MVVNRHYTQGAMEGASEAMLGMGLIVALAALRKSKAGLIYSAQNTQDYPPDTLELGTALDALDFAMGDVINWLSDASIDDFMDGMGERDD